MSTPSIRLETQPPWALGRACDPRQVHQNPSLDHMPGKGILQVRSFEEGSLVLPVAKFPTRVSSRGTEKNQTEVKRGKDRKQPGTAIMRCAGKTV